MAKPEPRPSRVPPHAFEDDEDIGVQRDWRGRRYWHCAACHLVGEPGDDRHPHGALPLPRPTTAHPPAPAGATEFDARKLGERGAA